MANQSSNVSRSGPESPTDTKKEERRVPWLVLAVFLITAILILALLAWSVSSARFLFSELLIGAAAISIGGLLGFLFGMPRGRADGQTSEGNGESNQAISYRPSNNLEQVSDWLTKILIGVGLVELKQLVGTLNALGRAVEDSLKDAPAGTSVVTQGAVVVFLVLGFIASFLWTRIYYSALQTLADNALVRELREERDTAVYLTKQMAQGEIPISPAVLTLPAHHDAVRGSAGSSGDMNNWNSDTVEKIEKFRRSPPVWNTNPGREIFGDAPAERNGRRLRAEVVNDLGLALVLKLIVDRIKGDPLEGTVVFLLHPTFAEPVIYEKAKLNRAERTISTGGWFTAVAIMDEGNTVLSYDLRTMPNVPQWFKEESIPPP